MNFDTENCISTKLNLLTEDLKRTQAALKESRKRENYYRTCYIKSKPYEFKINITKKEIATSTIYYNTEPSIIVDKLLHKCYLHRADCLIVSDWIWYNIILDSIQALKDPYTRDYARQKLSDRQAYQNTLAECKNSSSDGELVIYGRLRPSTAVANTRGMLILIDPKLDNNTVLLGKLSFNLVDQISHLDFLKGKVSLPNYYKLRLNREAEQASIKE